MRVAGSLEFCCTGVQVELEALEASVGEADLWISRFVCGSTPAYGSAVRACGPRLYGTAKAVPCYKPDHLPVGKAVPSASLRTGSSTSHATACFAQVTQEEMAHVGPGGNASHPSLSSGSGALISAARRGFGKAGSFGFAQDRLFGSARQGVLRSG
ncbi:MAG: hypothetical protein JOY95_10165 [Silvibacterium sp.]|nr:hypothetical protein [Silvibacterium sp.]